MRVGIGALSAFDASNCIFGADPSGTQCATGQEAGVQFPSTLADCTYGADPSGTRCKTPAEAGVQVTASGVICPTPLVNGQCPTAVTSSGTIIPASQIGQWIPGIANNTVLIGGAVFAVALFFIMGARR